MKALQGHAGSAGAYTPAERRPVLILVSVDHIPDCTQHEPLYGYRTEILANTLSD
jgi:hypothetical protein